MFFYDLTGDVHFSLFEKTKTINQSHSLMEKLHHHKFRCLKAINDTSKNMASSDQYAVNSDWLSTLVSPSPMHFVGGSKFCVLTTPYLRMYSSVSMSAILSMQASQRNFDLNILNHCLWIEPHQWHRKTSENLM